MQLYECAAKNSVKDPNTTVASPLLPKNGEIALDMNPLVPAAKAAGMESCIPFNASIKECDDILHINYLCSKAKFDKTDIPIEKRNIIGDATESGLFSFAARSLSNSDKVTSQSYSLFIDDSVWKRIQKYLKFLLIHQTNGI